jgi:hypothetical protein
MPDLLLIKAAVIVAGVALILIERATSRGPAADRLNRILLGGWAAANVGFLLYLFWRHAGFPLHLDIMEGAIWQHFLRAAAGEPVYPAPSAEFVPFAYNPLFYYVAVPFSWVLGQDLSTLRIVAMLGTLAAAGCMFYAVRRETGSLWWAFLVIGLLAAAYRVMDDYVDTAHGDSWLIACTFAGSCCIALNRGLRWNLTGVCLLVVAFWFKQHGALFAIGGVLYLTSREGPRKSIPYWFAAGLLGPGIYAIGPWLFGSHFHFFTWTVPSNWSEPSLDALRRYARFLVLFYPVIGLAALWRCADAARRSFRDPGIWQVQFLFAVLSGLMGSLDPGSSDNVYIPVGAWAILVGTMGLASLATRFRLVKHWHLHHAALIITFACFLYDPRPVIPSHKADAAYADFVAELGSIQGHVYAPSLGQFSKEYTFLPAAHWVALEDLVRGPGQQTEDHPRIKEILAPALDPEEPLYILSNQPLDQLIPALYFLEDYYTLDHDYGDRFKPLRVLPARWDHRWPQYRYRYTGLPETAPKAANDDVGSE